jgi:hypothetical protein
MARFKVAAIAAPFADGLTAQGTARRDDTKASACYGELGRDAGRAGEACGHRNRCRPNGEGAKLRGQGPLAEAAAARRLPACEVRDAGGVTPSSWR